MADTKTTTKKKPTTKRTTNKKDRPLSNASANDINKRFADDLKNGRSKTNNGKEKPEAVIVGLVERVLNASLQRRDNFLKGLLDDRRDINDECGYPETNQLTSIIYKKLYDREPIAARVVEVLPKESWQVPPLIFETEDLEDETDFEKAWDLIGDNLGGKSWHDDKENNRLWEYLLRVDIHSGIGSFGGLLLGLDDGKNLEEPAEFKEGQKLTFLRVFDQTLIEVAMTEGDEKNPRFGHPTMYNVEFIERDNSNAVLSSLDTESSKSKKVHWTRIIHIADNLGSSEIFGTPRQQTPYNRLYDLRKIYGADGETFWRNAVLKLFLETIPQLGPDVILTDPQKEDLKDMMEQLMNGMQQWAMLSGMTVKTVAPAVIDPTPHIDVHITAICILTGTPKRIFMGSERGELASGQDDKTWNDRLRHRQLFYLTPRVIVPTIDRFILLGILPEPKEGYHVEWPDLNTLSDAEKAAIAIQKTDALVKYVNGNGNAVVTEGDFLSEFLHFTREKVIAMLEATDESLAVENEGEDDDVANPIKPKEEIPEDTNTGHNSDHNSDHKETQNKESSVRNLLETFPRADEE